MLDGFEGKVIFVDDEEIMRNVLTREAERAGIEDFEVLEDAASAVARLEGLGEVAAAIFSDGLFGGWKEVIAAAKAERIPAFVVSGDIRLQQDVEAAGATFMSKAALRLGFVEQALESL